MKWIFNNLTGLLLVIITALFWLLMKLTTGLYLGTVILFYKWVDFATSLITKED